MDKITAIVAGGAGFIRTMATDTAAIPINLGNPQEITINRLAYTIRKLAGTLSEIKTRFNFKFYLYEKNQKVLQICGIIGTNIFRRNNPLYSPVMSAANCREMGTGKFGF